MEAFIFTFFKLVTLEEKMTLYFVTQTGGKQHMALLTAAKSKLTNPGVEETYHCEVRHLCACYLGLYGLLLLLLSSSQGPADISLVSQTSQKGKNHLVIRK